MTTATRPAEHHLAPEQDLPVNGEAERVVTPDETVPLPDGLRADPTAPGRGNTDARTRSAGGTTDDDGDHCSGDARSIPVAPSSTAGEGRGSPDAQPAPALPGIPPTNGIGHRDHGTRDQDADADGPDHPSRDAQRPGVGSAREAGGDRETPGAPGTRVAPRRWGAGSGRKQHDAHSEAAGPAPLISDLDILHASLGHYARQVLDIQKARIAMSNRAAAMERDGLGGEWVAPIKDAVDHLAKLENSLTAHLAKQAARHPLAPWIKQQRGIGLAGFARLLGITGPISNFPNVAKLWAYLGLHTVEGLAPKRRKGVRLNYSPEGRVLCHQIGESIVKVGGDGVYRLAYDFRKAAYEMRHPEWTQAHRHQAAMRYAVKELVRELWREWDRLEKDGAL
jgi:hypothetical protein